MRLGPGSILTHDVNFNIKCFQPLAGEPTQGGQQAHIFQQSWAQIEDDTVDFFQRGIANAGAYRSSAAGPDLW